MILQSLVIIAFILIIISLGKALFHLVNHKTEEQSQKTVKSLTFRIQTPWPRFKNTSTKTSSS